VACTYSSAQLKFLFCFPHFKRCTFIWYSPTARTYRSLDSSFQHMAAPLRLVHPHSDLLTFLSLSVVSAFNLCFAFLFSSLLPLSSPSLSLSSLPPSSRPLHTSSSLSARYKSRHTHKPFWHVKKTAKQADDPVTATNRAFVEEVKQNRYVNTRIDDDERNDDDANRLE
jgi:hypothetical protein